MSDPHWLPVDLERIEKIPFTDDDGPRLELDLYRRRNCQPDRPAPVVVWLHGGGWMSGDRERGVERIFGLVRAGCIGASVSYRLSQVALFPAQLHDVKAAVRFLRTHARQYGIDANRIAAWGASAGGHLASLLAVTGEEAFLEGERGWPETSSRVQAACSWFGPSDLNLMDRFPPGVTPRLPSMGFESAEGRLVGGAVSERQEVVSLANPIRYIHPGTPPLMLMHGARDDVVPLASSEAFYAALLKGRRPAQLHVIPDGHHNAYHWGEHHLRLVEEFFLWHLRESEEHS